MTDLSSKEIHSYILKKLISTFFLKSPTAAYWEIDVKGRGKKTTEMLLSKKTPRIHSSWFTCFLLMVYIPTVCRRLACYQMSLLHCVCVCLEVALSVCWFVRLFGPEWMDFDVHGFQRIQLTLEIPWLFLLSHYEVDVCGFKWNVSTTFGWITMEFTTGVYVPLSFIRSNF